MRVRGNNQNFFQEYEAALSSNQAFQDEYVIELNYILLKRMIDIVLSLVGLVIVAPIVFICIIFIKLESAGPGFFVQERVGVNGRYFNIFKLRSMCIDAEKNGAKWAERNDPRITKVGLFIRKTRIDELPQLWNVLKGDMSLVGPRPERPMFTAQFNDEIPGFVERLKVKPGVTGWAQINGGYEISPKEKLNLDIYYIMNQSFWLDLIIIIKTVRTCITGDGAR